MKVEFDIDDEFEHFMRQANPAVKEHETQYQESRRVFFAGVASFYLFSTGKLPTLPEDEGVAQLEQVEIQIKDFFNKRLGFNQ